MSSTANSHFQDFWYYWLNWSSFLFLRDHTKIDFIALCRWVLFKILELIDPLANEKQHNMLLFCLFISIIMINLESIKCETVPLTR